MKKYVLACVLCLCSLSAVSMQLVETRIIGGVDVTAPPAYLVHLRVGISGGGSQVCGGSYIGDGRVLTAAHCLFDGSGNTTSNVQMYFNIPNGDLRNIAQADRIDSSFFEIHPGYDNNRFFLRDAAVIFLPGEVPDGVSAIVLAERTITDDAMANERIATAYGWGLTDPDDRESVPDQLQGVDLNVDRESFCERYNLCSEFILYAGSQNDGQDACQGDSGGPLALNNTTGVPLLLGLTSFGVGGCAEEGEAGGYTRVSTIREWALDIESGRQIIETSVIAKRTTTGEGSLSLAFIALLAVPVIYLRKKKLLVKSSC